MIERASSKDILLSIGKTHVMQYPLSETASFPGLLALFFLPPLNLHGAP